MQIRRRPRSDGTVTYSLRVRVAGGDEAVQLGNTSNGWDEARAEKARQQVLAKIELGLWSTRPAAADAGPAAEPTFAELATEWLDDRKRNSAIRSRTIDDDSWRLTRYLIPFFGDLMPSQITPLTVKHYRRRIHEENAHIRTANEDGNPLRDPRTGQPLRPLSNDSINKTLRTLAVILDEAEDGGWITRNVARGRRTRETVERHKGEVLDIDEFEALLEAAAELDAERHRPSTLLCAQKIRTLRGEAELTWKEIALRIRVAPATAVYLYGCASANGLPTTGPRRAVIATLGLAGPRVSELCALDNGHVDLARRKIYVRDSKTEAGIRSVDIRPRLLAELAHYRGALTDSGIDRPAFPTRAGGRRNKDNVRLRVITAAVERANALRRQRGEPAIRAHVTPHTLRRTFITFMLAAGFDLPYVQDQVGHLDPKTTLGIYAQVIRRPDRDAVRAEVRALLGEDRTGAERDSEQGPRAEPSRHEHRHRERGGLER